MSFSSVIFGKVAPHEPPQTPTEQKSNPQLRNAVVGTIRPQCTSSATDKLGLLVRRGDRKTVTKKVDVELETELMIKPHSDDVVCEQLIGEWSFELVNKGVYERNDVAVKKTKDVDRSKDAMDEFAKEVAMPDKFRCDNFVNFNGAFMIPNHLMLATEVVPCGSLADFIKKRAEPDDRTKVNLMLDAARGLDYLHTNGILHSDIKLDSIFVFDLNLASEVNAKRTDFGSSRNINLLMTNMTFTKGVGSPNYMAPEVLNMQKYKKAVDVYSFGVMLYECFVLYDALPKEQFEFPLQISARHWQEQPAQIKDMSDGVTLCCRSDSSPPS